MYSPQNVLHHHLAIMSTYSSLFATIFNIIILITIILVIIIIIIILTIIITRPKPAYGRQGLAGGSLRTSGAELGGKL